MNMRIIVRSIIVLILLLLILLVWRMLNKHSRGPYPLQTQELPQDRGDLKTPMILNGNFSYAHLTVEDLLADNYLDSLIRGAKRKKTLDVIYGAPLSEKKDGEILIVTYNLAVYDEGLRKKGGRIGFIGKFKDEVLISWSPVMQVNSR